MSEPDTLRVRVAHADSPTPLIRRLRLVAADGGALPPFRAGAHVQVRTGEGAWRAYSLVRLEAVHDPAAPQPHYLIAVRREDDGRGGSRWMHAVAAGDELTIRPPANQFALEPEPAVLLVAGGIGITPIATMAAELVAAGRPFVLHYAGRSASQLAFVDELRALCGERLVVHADDDPAGALSVDAVLAAATPRQPIYVCGPAGLIDAVRERAARSGWPAEAVRSERFSDPGPQTGDRPFQVELRRSGRTLDVPAGRSLLEVLEQAGCDVMHDCRAGYCGLCSTAVCAGDLDHRDTYLSEADRRSGRVIQPCVSRARGTLVLDL